MSTTLHGKEFRELQRRFKKGYAVEQGGDGHYRIRDPDGDLVRNRKGTLLVIPSTSSRGVGKSVLLDLEHAGVLRATPTKTRAKVDPDVAKERRKAALAETTRLRSQGRQVVADDLYARVNPLVQRLGGWDVDGIVADLAYVGAQVAREENLPGVNGRLMTPDLLVSSMTRIRDRHWVTPEYQAVWNALTERLTQADSVTDEFFALIRKARHLPETVVIDSQLVLPSEGEWPFRVELLKLDQCLVDHTYQRPVPWPFVRKMAATFDPTLVGTIDVSERGHGAVYAILDGQCRYEAMRLKGFETVWASVYVGLDVQAEASFFLAKNGDRKAIHPYYTFMAKIAAGKPDALAIERIVKKFGYRIYVTSAGGVHDERNISAVGALEYAYAHSSDARPECLTPTLGTLKASTFGRPSGQASQLIRGLGRFFSLHEEVDQERLDSVVASRGATWLLGAAKEYAKGAGSAQIPAMSRLLAEEYNKGLDRRERLPVK